MRDALPELGVQARMGLNTGEVVTGTGRLATGDAVNLAARLEQAAQRASAGRRGRCTLVRGAVEAEEVAPLAAERESQRSRWRRSASLALARRLSVGTRPAS